jgi:hypothetical protein
MALITPANYVTNNHLKNLRELLLKEGKLDEVLVIEGGVFAGVSVDTAITVLSRHKGGTDFFILRHALIRDRRLIDNSHHQLAAATILNDKHLLFTGSSLTKDPLWEKAELVSQHLSEIATVSFGKQLRDRKIFTNDVIQIGDGIEIPNSHRPCFTGKDINRYTLTWSGLACLTSTEAQSGGCWDESKHLKKNKLLTRQIGKTPTFGLDTKGYDCLNTIFMVCLINDSIEPAFVLGVLNSRLMQYLWLNRFYDQRGTFPKIKGTYLKLLPIVRITNSNRQMVSQVARLVDKILVLIPSMRTAKSDTERAALLNAIRKTDRDIDKLVYELYGLTPEEIALVEGTAETPDTEPAAAEA